MIKNFQDGAGFFVGMKKLAEALAAPAPPAGEPMSPFLVPVPEAIGLMAQMVSNELKTHAYYLYYANMLRGMSRAGIADEFLSHADDELHHANYLLRRIGVISPGGTSIPPYPPPPPLTDANEIVQQMIVVEQMGLNLWRQLHSVMGDDPMKYSIEDFLRTEEEHQDELTQLVEATPPPEAPAAPAKTAMQILEDAFQRKQASLALTEEDLALTGFSKSHLGKKERKADVEAEVIPASGVPCKTAAVATFEQLRNAGKPPAVARITDKDSALAALGSASLKGSSKEKAQVRAAVKKMYPDLASPASKLSSLVSKLAEDMIALPGPEADSPEAYVEREQRMSAQQAMAEASHAKTVSMQSAQAAQKAQAEAQAAQQQLQEMQAQLEQAQMQMQQGSQQALQSQQMAAEAEARAANHSISKMQLGMRMNQMRQELANFVMQDPVSENAATVSDLAAQGQPATPQQQADAEMQAAMGAAGPPSAEAQEEGQEAQNAQQHAQVQAEQAQQAQAADQQKKQASATQQPPSLMAALKPHLPGLMAGIGIGIIGTNTLGGMFERRPPEISDSPLAYAQYYR